MRQIINITTALDHLGKKTFILAWSSTTYAKYKTAKTNMAINFTSKKKAS